MKKTLQQRFWEKVNKGKPDECWEWIAAKYAGGYGFFRAKDKMMGTHRFSWELHNGKIPKDKSNRHGTMLICHNCDNPPCVNPKHLFLGTVSDNAKDAYDKGLITMPKSDNRGENGPGSKITNEVVGIIRELYKRPNLTQRDLAKEFNLKQATIWQIVNYKTWKHI